MGQGSKQQLPEHLWSAKTKTIEARLYAFCAGCEKTPGTTDPLPEGWTWDTYEPDMPYCWCGDCLGKHIEELSNKKFNNNDGGDRQG